MRVVTCNAVAKIFVTLSPDPRTHIRPRAPSAHAHHYAPELLGTASLAATTDRSMLSTGPPRHAHNGRYVKPRQSEIAHVPNAWAMGLRLAYSLTKRLQWAGVGKGSCIVPAWLYGPPMRSGASCCIRHMPAPCATRFNGLRISVNRGSLTLAHGSALSVSFASGNSGEC